MATTPYPATSLRMLCAAPILIAACLSACGDKAKAGKPGQALASIDGKEITVLQLNEELQRAGVAATQMDAASKQLLQVLIDRQLLQQAATREGLDREPGVLQAIERAKAMVIAQAYLQKHAGNPARPSAREVAEFFDAHPEFFSNRKQFSMREIVIAASDLTPAARAAADAAGSLDELAAWLDAHKLRYGSTQTSRSSAELPARLSASLLGKPQGQLFVVREGQRALFMTVTGVRDAPLTLAEAAPQIEQFLVNKRNRELASAALQRLRASARIEYLDKSLMPAAAPAARTPAARTPAAGTPAADAGADKAAIDRGVAGLK